MNRVALVVGVVVALGIIVFSTATFRVGEWQQAVVLQFGRPVRTVTEAGLHLKTPLVQNVVYFEKRLLEYDAAPKELITLDKQQLVVDNYSRWRIVDPLTFYQTVLSEAGAQSRLDDIIYSTLREAIGRENMRDVVSGDRDTLIDEVTKRSNEKARGYGVEIVDVRIKRTELPEKNEANVFRRMRTERERQAKKFRAEGDEEARKIRSQAERDRKVLLAEASRKAEVLRGEGDAKAAETYAAAYDRDPEFYKFLRTLEAYDTSLRKRTTLVLTPSSEFLGLLDSPKPSKKP